MNFNGIYTAVIIAATVLASCGEAKKVEFVHEIKVIKLKLDIKAHEELIKTTQKDHQKLIDDGKKLQEQIDKNKIEQENKLKEIEGHNQKLEGMKGKIKN